METKTKAYKLEDHGDAQVALIDGEYAGVFRRVDAWTFEPSIFISEAAKARLKLEFRSAVGYSGKL